MATETTERQGYFTGWTVKTEGIIAPDERPTWGQSIFLSPPTSGLPGDNPFSLACNTCWPCLAPLS